MVKLQQKGDNQFFITIPKSMVNLMRWKKGIDIAVTADQYEKDLILKRVIK